MLTNSGNRHYSTDDDDMDFVHNYYEKLVLQEVANTSKRVQSGDREFLGDVACVALNRLPPRYIRHDVDMTFFMSPQEMLEIETKVKDAVDAAIAYVERRERGEDHPREGSLAASKTTRESVKTPGTKKAANKKSAPRKAKE